MESVTIRVSRSTHDVLRVLAAQLNEPMSTIVDVAVRDLQRRKFWEEFNASCATLKETPGAWTDLRNEDEAWETTLADGLEPESASDE